MIARKGVRRNRNRIFAEDEIEEDDIPMEDEAPEEDGAQVAPEATDLLFEAEDVAELIAEVTGQEVEVTADENGAVFTVGEDEFTVEPEGDEEVLEAVRRPLRGKRRVAASTASRRPVPARRPVKASTSARRGSARTIKKVPSRRSR